MCRLVGVGLAAHSDPDDSDDQRNQSTQHDGRCPVERPVKAVSGDRARALRRAVGLAIAVSPSGSPADESAEAQSDLDQH